LSTHLLCYLTDVREEVVKRGRYSGQVKRYRYGVTAESSWMLSKFNLKDDGSYYPAVFKKDYGCFRLYFPGLKTNYYLFQIDPWYAVRRVKKALHELTGQEFKYSGPKDLAKVGRAMDEFYQCSPVRFHHPTNFTQILFKGRHQIQESNSG